MDLKSMLNVDAAGQRGPPRLTTGHSVHTPTSSFDGRIDHTPSGSSDVTSARPTPYGPPSYTGDSRAQGGGSYFAIQPLHPQTSTSSSTPSAGPPSAYAQSPGSYPQVHTPRDGIPPNHPGLNAVYATPSPGVYHPLTPGSAHHNHLPPNLIHSNSGHHPYHYSSPPPPQPNGLPPHPQQRQISPSSHFQSQPATPLGPPIAYARASPQAQRPTSQGGPVEHLRRASQSSIGSALSREFNQYPHPGADQLQRRDSVQSTQRTSYPYEPRDREQSMSVSPKTIPRPNPQRENSASSHTLSQRASLPPQPEHQNSLNHFPSPGQQTQLLPSQLVTPDMSMAGPRPDVHNPNTISSPAAQVENKSIMSSTDAKQEPQPSLKRGASQLDGSPSAAPPAPKRTRYDIPSWAQSRREQRGQKQIRCLDFNEVARDRDRRQQQEAQKQATQQQHNDSHPQQNGTSQPNGHGHGHAQKPVQPPQPIRPAVQNGDLGRGLWTGTISNITPNDSLATRVCDWIMNTIGRSQLPPDSMWEVEAKIGTIIDTQNKGRFHVRGVDNEALLNTHELPDKIRFESDMPKVSPMHTFVGSTNNLQTSHEACFNYLQSSVQRNIAAHEAGQVHDNLLARHTDLEELDDFYTLSPEGLEELHPGVRFWTDRSVTRGRNDPQVRVRKEIDLQNNGSFAYRIKSRIADKEVSIPDCKFDYRISISLETAWKGNEDHLRRLEDAKSRTKRRHSYRHREFQADLTLVSHYDDPSKHEYEAEVEISGRYLVDQIHKAMSGEENQYSQMVHDFINNTRLLCKYADPDNRP